MLAADVVARVLSFTVLAAPSVTTLAGVEWGEVGAVALVTHRRARLAFININLTPKTLEAW